jgi:hypothetical protein
MGREGGGLLQFGSARVTGSDSLLIVLKGDHELFVCQPHGPYLGGIKCLTHFSGEGKVTCPKYRVCLLKGKSDYDVVPTHVADFTLE